MRELEGILGEIEASAVYGETKDGYGAMCVPVGVIERIIRKHMNDGWIPAKKKPTEDGFYVATMSGSLVDQEEPFVGLAEFEDGEWVDGDNVIAWSPLPEPYRQEGIINEKD